MNRNIDINYRPDIDGLRAIAVLGVVLFHAFPNIITGGYVGVDVFFVISGYLITSIITKNYQNGTFSYADFYLRRFKRLFPALITVLLTCIVIGWYTMLPSEYEQLALHSLSGLGFVANISLYLESGYFDTDTETKALMHLWSLGIEEQFYLLWPLTLGLLVKINGRLPQWTLALLVTSYASSVLLTAGHPEASFFLIHTRAWELLAGALLAVTRPDAGKLSHLLSPAGLLIIFLSYLALDKDSIFPGWVALFPVMGAFLVIYPVKTQTLAGDILSSRLLTYVGKISFPLYLWHWPLLAYLRLVKPEAGSLAVLLVLFLAILLSVLTYHFIEGFFRHGNKSRTTVLAALTVIVVALSYNVHSRNGMDFRLRNAQDRSAEQALRWGDARRTDKKCEAIYQDKFTGLCLIFDETKKPDAIIIGDSHANHIYWGLGASLNKSGINLLQAASAGCVPLPDVTTNNKGQISTHCHEIIHSALGYAISSSDIKTIFLAGRWSTFITGRELREGSKTSHEQVLVAGKYYPELSRAAIFAQQAEKLLEELLATDKQIVFVYDVHELPYKATHCVTWSPNVYVTRQPKSNCFMPIDQVQKRDAEFRPLIDQVIGKYPKVIRLDPRKHLCDGRGCRGIDNGAILFRDDDHLSYMGSLILGEKLYEDYLAQTEYSPRQNSVITDYPLSVIRSSAIADRHQSHVVLE